MPIEFLQKLAFYIMNQDSTLSTEFKKWLTAIASVGK
jgi:hypothetical protein